MGILKKMFGSINPGRMIKGVANFVDESIQTKEEVTKNIIDHYKTSLDESTPRSITRRVIALAFVGVFIVLLLGSALAYPFMPEYAKFLLGLVKEIFGLVTTVTVFYFGGYYASKWIDRKK